MGCVKLHILDEQYKRTELKVCYSKNELTQNFCAENPYSVRVYAYCNNNPIMLIDPDGMEAKPYDKWNRLTTREKELAKTFPDMALKVNKNADKATKMTISIFGHNGRNDASDAFRHAYWQALNAKKIGSYMAKLFADAHESENTPDVENETQMDLHNNSVGNKIGMLNMSATEQELVELIQKAMSNGEMVVIDEKGNVVPLIIPKNDQQTNTPPPANNNNNNNKTDEK
jgi:hypothetical protein